MHVVNNKETRFIRLSGLWTIILDRKSSMLPWFYLYVTNTCLLVNIVPSEEISSWPLLALFHHRPGMYTFLDFLYNVQLFQSRVSKKAIDIKHRLYIMNGFRFLGFTECKALKILFSFYDLYTTFQMKYLYLKYKAVVFPSRMGQKIWRYVAKSHTHEFLINLMMIYRLPGSMPKIGDCG